MAPGRNGAGGRRRRTGASSARPGLLLDVECRVCAFTGLTVEGIGGKLV